MERWRGKSLKSFVNIPGLSISFLSYLGQPDDEQGGDAGKKLEIISSNSSRLRFGKKE